MTTTSSTSILDALLPQWEAKLKGWALDGSLSAAAQEALMLQGTPQALQDLIIEWGSGVFRNLPPIVLLSAAEINGAMGAYALSTGTIYLNADWLAGASKEQVFAVLTEELGHHLDGLLNAVDTPGDEGEYFSKLLGGQLLSEAERLASRKSNDIGNLNINSQQVSAGQASNALYSTDIATINYGSLPSQFIEELYDITRLPDGSFLLAGNIQGVGGYVLKLTSTGLPDSSFGSNGWILLGQLTRVTYVENTSNVIIAAGDNYGTGVAKAWSISPNGAVLSESQTNLGPYDFIGSGFFNKESGILFNAGYGFASNIDTAYLAWNTLGGISPNIAFGGTGKTLFDAGKFDYLYHSIIADSAGNLYSAGLSRAPDNASGEPFWSIGSVTNTAIRNTQFSGDGLISAHPLPNLMGSACTALALNAANNIIAIGGVQETGSAIYGIAVQIISTSGSILSSHKLTLPSGISLTNLEGVRDLKLASDGGFVFCFPARLANGETDIMVVKLTNNGLLDTAFGNGGFHQITRQGEQGLPELTLSPQGDIWISYKEISTSQIGLHHIKQNSTPTDIFLSTSSFYENIAAGSAIATLTSADPDISDNFTYALASGTGDTDNTAFSIIGNQLKINATPNYEAKSSYSIRVRTTDAGGLFTEKTFSLSVNDLDDTAPTVTSITVQGTAVILTFSEAVTALSVPLTAFSVQTVSGTTATPRTISNVALDQNNSSKVILTLSGTAPASNVNLRVSYTDPTGNQASGVVQDTAGNDLASFSNRFADTFITGSTTTLASQYQNLTLTGNSGVSGTGNALANIITGNGANNTLSGLAGNDTIRGENGNDTIIGGLGADHLSGGAGTDTFRLALADSLLGTSGTPGYDKITDFAIGTDRLDGPTAVTAANVKDGNGSINGVGIVQTLDAAGIGTLLNSNSNFAANGASVFTYNDPTAGRRTFVALNNSAAAFSASTDAIIEITGYSGSLTNLAIV